MSVSNRYSVRTYWLLAGYSAVSLAVFWVAYPTHFLIADEVAYFEQALKWGSASPSTVSDYPPGTALLAAGFVYFFGSKAVFWSGLVAWLVGIWSLAGMLHRLNKPIVWALYPALFLPGLVLTRTLMSDLPSFALACIFLRLYVQSTSQPVNQSTSLSINQSTRFVAGLVAGLGVLFRETNLLWAAPFLVGGVWREWSANPTTNPSSKGEGGYIQTYLKYSKLGCICSRTRNTQVIRGQASLPLGGGVGGGADSAILLWLGFLIGLVPRLAWGWFSFRDPLFVRDSGIDFSLSFLLQNLGFYVFALLVLAPGGLYFLLKNQSPYRWEITAAVALLLGVYGCYGYDAFAKSGIKGLVLQGRFLLPLLPFVALAAAATMPRLGQKVQIGIGATALVLFVGVQILGHAHNTEQQRITNALLQLPEQTHLSFTPDESRKYINALHGPQIQHSTLNTQHCFAHLITRSDSADRIKKTIEAEAAFQRYSSGRKTTLVTDLTIRDGTRLRVWRILQSPADEQTR